MIMSCGMASPDEIQDAVDACHRKGNEQIVLLKCCSEYPSQWDDMKLLNIPDMKTRFNTPIGLSDHSMGSLGAVVAVALGACVIEKHIKKVGVESADAEFSMSIEEYKALISDVKAAKKMLKGPDYSLTEGENASRAFRRSLFAVKDIFEGDIFSADNVRSIRPDNGISPKYLNQLIGRKAKRDIGFGEPIEMSDIE